MDWRPETENKRVSAIGETVRTFHNTSDKNCHVPPVVIIYFGHPAFRQYVFYGLLRRDDESTEISFSKCEDRNILLLFVVN